VLKTTDEAREWTRRILALGADIVPFQNGRAADEVVRTAFDEAHKAGKLTLIRAGGPEILPRKAADLGADLLPHSAGVAIEGVTTSHRTPGTVEAPARCVSRCRCQASKTNVLCSALWPTRSTSMPSFAFLDR